MWIFFSFSLTACAAHFIDIIWVEKNEKILCVQISWYDYECDTLTMLLFTISLCY